MDSYIQEVADGTVSREDALKQVTQDFGQAWGSLVRIRNVFKALGEDEVAHAAHEGMKEVEFALLDFIQITEDGKVVVVES